MKYFKEKSPEKKDTDRNFNKNKKKSKQGKGTDKVTDKGIDKGSKHHKKSIDKNLFAINEHEKSKKHSTSAFLQSKPSKHLSSFHSNILLKN